MEQKTNNLKATSFPVRKEKKVVKSQWYSNSRVGTSSIQNSDSLTRGTRTQRIKLMLTNERREKSGVERVRMKGKKGDN